LDKNLERGVADRAGFNRGVVYTVKHKGWLSGWEGIGQQMGGDGNSSTALRCTVARPDRRKGTPEKAHKRTLVSVLACFRDDDRDKPSIGIEMLVLAVHGTLYRFLIALRWRRDLRVPCDVDEYFSLDGNCKRGALWLKRIGTGGYARGKLEDSRLEGSRFYTESGGRLECNLYFGH
jgi:hypothetical protein